MSHKVKILLNREEKDGRLAIFDRFGNEPRYVFGDLLEEVASFDTDKGEGILDLAYEMFNRGAPKFVGDYMYPHRSLSAGDVIEIDGSRWSVESVGFAPIPEPPTVEFQIYSGPDPDGHAAEMLELAEMDFHGPVKFQDDRDIGGGWEPDPDPDLKREAHEEMEAEGAVIEAEESWFGGFSQFIDGHGNGSGRGY